MLTFRCTRKLLEYLDVDPIEDPSPSTGKLGDWYANLVPTYSGDLILFVNEESLITVAVPTVLADDLILTFRSRVRNLLLIHLCKRLIERSVIIMRCGSLRLRAEVSLDR